MPAFLISDVSVQNADALETYRTRAADSIARYSGNYLVGGGGIETLGGTWNPRMIIFVEFTNLEQAELWRRSRELCGRSRGA